MKMQGIVTNVFFSTLSILFYFKDLQDYEHVFDKPCLYMEKGLHKILIQLMMLMHWIKLERL